MGDARWTLDAFASSIRTHRLRPRLARLHKMRVDSGVTMVQGTYAQNLSPKPAWSDRTLMEPL